MKSCEAHILSVSDYYNYAPSVTAIHTFFYPICTGHFFYESGYHQHRNSFDSFLLMYIHSGSLTVDFMEHSVDVAADSFVLLDCYKPHGYHTSTGFEATWCHFDGPMARACYDLIVSRLGTIFSLSEQAQVLAKLNAIYHTFSNNDTIREPLLSKQINDMLTLLLLYTPFRTDTAVTAASSMEEIVSYINEHFTRDITVNELAKKASLSPYHFIRVFKKETGFTPHEYLINTRISTAKYLLKNSKASIKNICFDTGFSCESVFSTSFKKNVGLSPAEYRRQSPN